MYSVHLSVSFSGRLELLEWKGLADALAGRPASTARTALGLRRSAAQVRLDHFRDIREVLRCDFTARVLGTEALSISPVGWGGGVPASGGFRVLTSRPGPTAEASFREWGLVHRVEQYGEHTWEGVVPAGALTDGRMTVRRVFPVPLGVEDPVVADPVLSTAELPLDPREVLALFGREVPTIPPVADWEPGFYRPDLVPGARQSAGQSPADPQEWERPAPVTRPAAVEGLDEARWRELLGPRRYWVMRARHLGHPSREQAPREGLPLRCAACAQVVAAAGHWTFRPSDIANDLVLDDARGVRPGLPPAGTPGPGWGPVRSVVGCPSCGGLLGVLLGDEGDAPRLVSGAPAGPDTPADLGTAAEQHRGKVPATGCVLRPAVATVTTRTS